MMSKNLTENNLNSSHCLCSNKTGTLASRTPVIWSFVALWKSNCWDEPLDRQLSEALRLRRVHFHACMSCSCRLLSACSVTLARASTLMRRLFRQQQAVCNAAFWCANDAWKEEAQISFSVSWVYDKLLHSFEGRGGLVYRCGSFRQVDS